jgi:formylglycine-generating enzyme required for sulfatase activity
MVIAHVASFAALLSLLFTAVPALAVEQGPLREPKSGMELVRIPGGEFEMGSSDGGDNEQPVHRVRVSEFWLGKTEVTVGQYRRFVEATGYRTDAEKEGNCWTVDFSGYWKKQGGMSWREPGFPQGDDHPVVCVSWNDAKAFADWAGLRLPTEAEREYAAGNGARHTKYSWGDGSPAGPRGGNVADESAKRRWGGWQIFPGYDDGYQATAPVCSFEPNDFGLCDMTGNAWEWVSDWYGDT